MAFLDRLARLGRRDEFTLEERVGVAEERLYEAALGVDRIDPYLGVGTSLLMTSDHSLLIGFGALINLSEALFLKVPYLVAYYRTTHDWRGTSLLGVKSLITTVAPHLSFLQLFPAHYWVMKRYLRKYHREHGSGQSSTYVDASSHSSFPS